MLPAVFAKSLGELVERVEAEGRALLEYRGRLFEADQSGIRARFAMGEGLEGIVVAPRPGGAPSAEQSRALLLRALNGLVQRCGMFETCERAYQSVYGKRPV
jgi:hypothetical protein